ncbi:hypothetical protein ACQPU1_10210 [Clostridium paraputrificum]|uniref:hypothetical protein n=1 Tax=Clostridium TaxID=1485 RepID=UPI003D32BF1C
MSLWLNDFKSFIQEKRLTLKILIFLIILLSLFANALILITKDYSVITNGDISEKSFTTLISYRNGDAEAKGLPSHFLLFNPHNLFNIVLPLWTTF